MTPPPPKLQLPKGIVPPTPTYSPNSVAHSPKSTSITGRTSFQIPELFRDSAATQPSQAQNQNDGQLSPTPAAEGEAQYASAKPYFEERNI